MEVQLKNPKKIKDIIKEAKRIHHLDDGRDVEVLLVYVPSSLNGGDNEKLFEVIKEEIFHNFVFSCGEVEKKIGVKVDNEEKEKLLKKAIRKISKKTAKGELGEMILFTLLDVYMEAPKILSKVSLKTNRKMPVYGADAVHGKFKGDDFFLYLGESKLHKSFSSASTKAAVSIKEARQKYEEEFDLLDSYMDYPGMDESSKSKLISFLNPFSDDFSGDFIESPCFIGFSRPEMFEGDEDDFLDKCHILTAKCANNFYSKVEGCGGEVSKVTLFVLPFFCIDHLVSDFLNYFEIM